jgi:uncharacterized membrane protein
MTRSDLDRVHSWRAHPGVRGGSQLPLGERAADVVRNGMGSWAFVFCALAFLALWMGYNGHHGFDPYPFILLNLVLSCLAALQGAILLIAAKRSDQVASELARHDFETDRKVEGLVEHLSHQHKEIERQLAELTELIARRQRHEGPEPHGPGPSRTS